MSNERVIDTSDLRGFEEELKLAQQPKRGGLVLPHIMWGEWHLISKKHETGKGYYPPELKYSVVVIPYTANIPSETDIRNKLQKNHVILAHYFPKKSDINFPDSDTLSGWLMELKVSDSPDPYYKIRQFCESSMHSSLRTHNSNLVIEEKDAEIARLQAMIKESGSAKGKAKAKEVF